MNFAKFAAFKNEIDGEIATYLKTLKATPLQEPVAYSLSSSGKRLRPILTVLMAKSLGKGFCVKQSALAIEFFHTASLIADDLPCMDDDDFRRSKPSLHKKFGESTALLASYGLMIEGFSQIEKSGTEYAKKGYGTIADADKRVRIALKETAGLSGVKGAVLGQYFDIEKINTGEEESFEELYYLKTGTIFQGAFILGYIFGGGDLEKIPLIEKISRHLGFAFQVRDDIEDIYEEDLSYPKKFGEERSLERCKKEIESFYQALDQLKVEKNVFKPITDYLFPTEMFQTSQHALL